MPCPVCAKSRGGGSAPPVPPAAPAYANPGGTGDRLTRISFSCAGFTGGPFAGQYLLDGSSGGWWMSAATSGCSLTFDLGYRHVIDEAKFYQSGSETHGTWKWQASNDATAWTDIGAAFTLGGATVQTHTALNANATAYRFYRLQGVSGTPNNGPNINEMEFRIGGAADVPRPAATVWETGNRTASITITSSGVSVIGAISAWVDGNTGAGWWTNSTTVAGAWIRFDFGSPRIVDACRWWKESSAVWGTWQWQGSNNGSSWTDIGPSYTPGTGNGNYDHVYPGTRLDLSLASNRTAYRYYRLLGVSGSFQAHNMYEMEFRLL